VTACRRRRLSHPLSASAALVSLGLMLICSCTASPTSGDSPRVSAIQSGLASGAFVPALTPTPTVAPSLPTGSTACGNSLISATTPTGTEPLLDCAGMAYGTPMIQVHVGDQILLSGLEDRTFVTSSPAAILDVHGSLLTARQLGAATIIVHNWFCVPANGTQATSCPLAQVTVT